MLSSASARPNCVIPWWISHAARYGRTVRMLNLIDEHTRESLLVRPGCRWSSAKVIEALANVMVMKDVPPHIRSDNGPEFVACELHKWLAATVCATPTLHGTKDRRINHFRFVGYTEVGMASGLIGGSRRQCDLFLVILSKI